MMHIAAPVCAPEEVIQLKQAGADELYCGYLPEQWRNVYGGHDTISRRQGKANLGSERALRCTANLANSLHMPIFLALNGRYTALQYPVLLQIAHMWADAGGTGLILRDVGFMQVIGKHKLPLRLCASLLALCVNADCVRFFRGLGASRIVLPRFLSVREMKEITLPFPDMEFEAMVMGDGCPMIDGLCRSLHSENGTEAPPLCHTVDRGGAIPCAACLVPALTASGVRYGKLGGRGRPIEERRAQTAFFSMAAQGVPENILQAAFPALFSEPCHCYYGRDE